MSFIGAKRTSRLRAARSGNDPKRFPKSQNVGLVPLVLPTETALTEAEFVQRWNEQACCQRVVVVIGLEPQDKVKHTPGGDGDRPDFRTVSERPIAALSALLV
jgi:hypothetical protein